MESILLTAFGDFAQMERSVAGSSSSPLHIKFDSISTFASIDSVKLHNIQSRLGRSEEINFMDF